MKVTFDSNAWERIFAPRWALDPAAQHIAAIRSALMSGAMLGFICETTFRLETLKRERVGLIASSEFTMLECKIRPGPHGEVNLMMSFGSDDRRHPGIDHRQLEKLTDAFRHGVRLIDGTAWMGLAGPSSPDWRSHAVPLNEAERTLKEELHTDVFYALQHAGVGMAPLNARLQAMERANGLATREGGWKILGTISDERERSKAVAEISEWADAEVIATHYGYQNDILCTEDRASSAKRSSFDDTSRRMLTKRFGIRFANLADLAGMTAQHDAA
ncbi:MAG: hypothetical protein ABL907_07945 [Hyphomicrobium sp.]